MEQLEIGKTVIAKKMMNDKENGTVTEVEVIYGGETKGYLRTQKGDIKKIADEQYKEILDEYRAKQIKSEAVDRLINEGEEESDPEEEENTREPVKQAIVKASSGTIISRDKGNTDEIRKLDRKKLIIPIIALVVVILVLLGLLLVKTIMNNNKNVQATNQDAVCVALLTRNVAIGDYVTSSDFEASWVSRETFGALSRTMYIGADGSTHEGTVILWNDISKYENCIALRSMDQGSVAMADDFSLSRSGITGQMTLRLVAVISSDSLSEDGDMVIELGRYVVEAGSLADILNSQNESIIENLYSEAGTPENIENIDTGMAGQDEEIIDFSQEQPAGEE